MKMGLKYVPSKWYLLIDSSKQNLKCVLQHNGKKYGSVPIDHLCKMTEEQKQLPCSHNHQWLICMDMKKMNFLLGQ